MAFSSSRSHTQRTRPFKLVSSYNPSGDQGKVIDEIQKSLEQKNREQTILGVTGSGKTFMMASLVNNLQKPTLVIAHNKTLAAQLAEEFRRFFPENAVHYFVSYYDYYQPESYVPRSDTFIEKQTQINEEIERLRNATTQALLTRKDVLIVASVSCIYGLGNPEDFNALKIEMIKGEIFKLDKLKRRLIDMQFIRSDLDLRRGTFRVRGDVIEIMPAGEEMAYRFAFFGDELETIEAFDPLTQHIIETLESYVIFPAKQYVTTQEKIQSAISRIQEDLNIRVKYFYEHNMLLQAERLKQRTNNDIEMLQTLGFVSGIENYSSYFDGRGDGEPPTTLLDYFPQDSLCFIDESHITIPQIAAMYSGDRSRKSTLVEYGFRLPSAMNNRPLKIDEFFDKVNQNIYVSATPADFELGVSNKISKSITSVEIEFRKTNTKKIVVSEAIIRPTGLIDPVIVLRPVDNQVDDVLEQVRQRVLRGERVLITALTKRFAEELDMYFKQINIKSAYIHSDVETLDRLDILSDLRRGKYDVLIGINLLREGLDLPEVSLVAIFDADKEGFLRSKTSLVQIIGRAARHTEGTVIMYADKVTRSMQFAIDETERRRTIQAAYNKKHGITPQSATRELQTIADDVRDEIESNEDFGKAGANYTATGWKVAESDSEESYKVESGYTRRTKKPTTSVQAATRMAARTNAKQVYDSFDRKKTIILEELRHNETPIVQLKSDLYIAIDANDFERAAAIRDRMEEMQDMI